MRLIIHQIHIEIFHNVTYLIFLLTFVKNELTFFTKSLTSESGGLYMTPTIKLFLSMTDFNQKGLGDLGFDNSWYHAQPHPIIV